MNKEELEKRKADFLQYLEEEPPFDKETFDLNMKSTFGTKWDWAQMQDDGVIGVHTSMYDIDGSHGTGGFVVLPDEKDYDKAKQLYGLSKPGDTYHRQQKLIDGQWVTVLEERPEQQQNTDDTKRESKSA